MLEVTVSKQILGFWTTQIPNFSEKIVINDKKGLFILNVRRPVGSQSFSRDRPGPV